MEYFCRHGPGDVQGQKIHHGDEYFGFVLDMYALGDDPHNAHMLYDSVFFSRPKGTDKSGLAARLAMWEALGPARFAGWAHGGEVYRDPWGMGFRYVYEAGEPMGKPVTAPFVRCMATEETQVGNVYATIYYNLTEPACPLSHVPGIDPGVEKVILPSGGEIRVSTASSSSKDGGKETFVVFDESHLYNTPDLRRMYDTVVRNLDKRKNAHTGAGTIFIETTTMFAPGEESVAEATFVEAEALLEGRKKRGAWRLFYDHRWGVCEDFTNPDLLRAALEDAYGEAVAWIGIDGLINAFYDTRRKSQDSIRFFLNAQTSTSDAWLTAQEWDGCRKAGRVLKPKDKIALGLDGSVRDDATALVAIRLSDMHIFPLGVWEKPEGAEGEDWQVDRDDVDAAVFRAMKTYKVLGFFMDPAHWQDYADKWSKEFGTDMVAKASAKRPLEFWTNRPTAMVAALQRFYEAIVEKRVTVDDPTVMPEGPARTVARALRRHALNARRRPSRAGLQIGKEHAKSPKKIDLVMAAVLGYEAAMEVLGSPEPAKPKVYPARRIR
jgi:hypothetical protein